MGEVVGPCDLDKALQLADRLEDEELARKLQLRKMILVDANLLIYAVDRRFPGVDHVNPLH